MRIGLDLRCLPADGSPGSGIAHATRALCSHLILDTSFDWIKYSVKTNHSSSALRRAIKQRPCDLLFVPSGAVLLGLDVPAIPWIHDLMILDHPEWFSESWLRRQFTTRFVLRGIKRAPIVFAVSEYTKCAIVRHTHIPADRIFVTGEGGDEELKGIKNSKLKIKNFSLKRPFVLALGTVEPRKNLAMLIRAWKQGGLKKTDLVIAGRWGWKFDDVKREIVSLTDVEKKYFHRIEDLDEDDKRQLLLSASAVAIPSLDEGFGLVALEAMQAGTPVIASNRGALPEVIGKAGLLLEPEDEQVWTDALAGIIDHKVSIANKTQASKFSWEKTAQVVLDGLRRCL